MNDSGRDYTIQSLHHALLVLESFLETEKDVQGISRIGHELGLNKSRVFRILNTLERQGFVEQDSETKQYRLGLRFLAFGDAVQRRLEIVQVAAPFLDELAEKTGETIHLGVLGGHEAICVAKRESAQSVRLYAEIGRRSPLHVGGVPKVLLAYMAPEERVRLMRLAPLPRITDWTITDPDCLESVLAQIRRDGYHVAVGDLDDDVHSIAAPIRNYTGHVVAAVSIAGPSHRFPPDKTQDCIHLVCAAATEISKKLGYTPVHPSGSQVGCIAKKTDSNEGRHHVLTCADPAAH
jgi:IclR family KDG regulon transcriptional repressor